MGHSETWQQMRCHVIKMFPHNTKHHEHERTETMCAHLQHETSVYSGYITIIIHSIRAVHHTNTQFESSFE